MKPIIVLLLCMLLAGLCACGQTAPEKTTTTTQEASHSGSSATTVEMTPEEITPYTRVLKLYHNRTDNRYGEPYQQYYALYDINGDGTKELMLGAKTNEEHGIGIYEVFVTQDGKAVQSPHYSLWEALGPAPQLFQNGAIKVFEPERNMIYYYKFEAGELKEKLCLEDNSILYEYGLKHGEPENSLGSPYYYYDPDLEYDPEATGYVDNSIPITKEEFEQMQKDMVGNGQVVEIAWTPLAEYEGGPWWLFW